MKVLHVIPSLDLRNGGPIRVVVELCLAGEKWGIESEIVAVGCPAPTDESFAQISAHSFPLSLDSGYGFSLGLTGWLRRNIKRFDCAILHGMWSFPTLTAARACQSAGVPYGIFPHGMLEPWSIFEQGPASRLRKTFYWYLFEKKVFSGAKTVLFTTERERYEATKVFGFSRPSRIACPFGIRDAGQSSSSGGIEGFGALEERKYVLFLGRLHPGKNIPLLLQAWAEANLPADWKIVVAGPSSRTYKRELESLSNRLGISERCIFIDFVTGKAKELLFRNAAWFALPSKHENFGIAMFEAVAYGCPVVVSDQVYASEFLDPLSRILPLELDHWVDFFRTRMQDADYRGIVIASDTEKLKEFTQDKLGEKWALTLHHAFLS